MLAQITDIEIVFYKSLLAIIISVFCGFLIGIERTRARKLFGARDHIAYAILSTTLIILYENFILDIGRIVILLIFGAMIIFLSIGSVYRLFHTDEPGYTSTMSMLLAILVGILSYYLPYLAIAISVIFLVILSTKKQFEKIRELKQIEWAGTVEFLAIVILLFLLIPENIEFVGINIRSIMIIFITILAIKYFSYFLLKSSAKNNLYYISFLGGFAHSEATTVELAEYGASSSSIWLVIQTMLLRMLLIILIGAIELFWYALFPILITTAIGLLGAFIILKNKKGDLKLLKIKNPLSIKGAIMFSLTYLLAILITFGLDLYVKNIATLGFFWYYIVAFIIGLLSGGASSLFVATSYSVSLITEANALIMLSIGISAAIINKVFYARKYLHESKNKKIFTFHLLIYQILTIVLLVTFTFITIVAFKLSFI
jgi:hypothetical protein